MLGIGGKLGKKISFCNYNEGGEILKEVIKGIGRVLMTVGNVNSLAEGCGCDMGEVMVINQIVCFLLFQIIVGILVIFLPTSKRNTFEISCPILYSVSDEG